MSLQIKKALKLWPVPEKNLTLNGLPEMEHVVTLVGITGTAAPEFASLFSYKNNNTNKNAYFLDES